MAEGSASVSDSRPLVCVQGLGFVGSAMAVAVASARRPDGAPCFDVIGIELDRPEGRARAAALNVGRLIFANTDPKIAAAHREAMARGNLRATTDPAAYARASVVIVDVNLDVDLTAEPPTVDFGSLRRALMTVADHVRAGTLIVVETTVPPGTCEKVIAPLLAERLEARQLPADAVLLAHSYERVMPGAAYFDSIVNFWRVYAGHTEAAAVACARFLEQLIDTRRFPLTRLASTTASELGKVVENSYRATTIAFIEEWSRLAEQVGVDLYTVIDAIRVRPTHSNLRQPGFGVGGYCLTKDPLLGGIAARQLFDQPSLRFPFSEMAVDINRRMPLETLRLLEEGLPGGLAGKRLLLLGVSYRADVGDTRYSPAELFVREARRRGAGVTCFDPLVARWEEFAWDLPSTLPPASGFDGVVFASTHSFFTELSLVAWLGDARPLVIDANRVLTSGQRVELGTHGVPHRSIGRGIVS